MKDSVILFVGSYVIAWLMLCLIHMETERQVELEGMRSLRNIHVHTVPEPEPFDTLNTYQH